MSRATCGRRPGRRKPGIRACGVLVALALASGSVAQADVGGAFSTTNTVFYESGGPLHMLVVTPGAEARVDVGDAFTVRAGYQADIVSGASVAVVDGPSSRPDVISSATKLDDIRHVAGGGIAFGSETTRLRANYAYGTESDYRSHAIDVSARVDLFERDTTLELTYARGFDQVCSLNQPRAQEAVDRQRLPSSTGCFSAGDRATLDVDLQTFQGSWTQAWTSVLATQLTFTTQLVDGFQSNPYRGVWLGRTAAQEHAPDIRARYAAGLGVKLWVRPARGAVSLNVRGYRDSWDLQSLTTELAYDQALGSGLSLRGRVRYYLQSGAAFYSDDYARRPMGQYFTGDRELSPMSSWTFGARLGWDVPANDDGDVLGFLSALNLVLKADVIRFSFDDFHYGQAAVPNRTALVSTLSLEAVF